MEIESLCIQIILSTKPRKQTAKSMSVTKIRSCLPYIVCIDQTHFAFSLCESRETVFVLYVFALFILQRNKDKPQKGFIKQESKVLLVSFCVLVVATRTIFFVNTDSFRRGIQSNQLPQ